MKIDSENISVVQILLVYYCNLGCSYCYQDFQHEIGLKKMSVDTFSKILSNFHDKKIDLNLFWGEPLLNTEIIDFMLSPEFLLPKSVEILSVNTNGVLMDKKFVQFVTKFRDIIHIDLSLDGNKENHDYYRKTLWGRPTYDDIVKNISQFNDLSFFTVNFCISPFTSDKLFLWIKDLYTLGFRKVKTIFLHEQPWTDGDFKNLASELYKLKAFQKYMDISLFHTKTKNPNECRDDFSKNYVFLPSGELIPCLVWLSKKLSKVPNVKPLKLEKIAEKEAYLDDNIFWNKELWTIMSQGAICENIQGRIFKKNQLKIERMLSKIF